MVVKINDKNLFEMEHDSNHRAWDILRRLREGEGLSISDYEFLVGVEIHWFNDPTRGIRKNRLGFYYNCEAMDKKPER